ncbi:hypothetical protein EJB05_13370, partial [Eragrostis curvula]
FYFRSSIPFPQTVSTHRQPASLSLALGPSAHGGAAACRGLRRTLPARMSELGSTSSPSTTAGAAAATSRTRRRGGRAPSSLKHGGPPLLSSMAPSFTRRRRPRAAGAGFTQRRRPRAAAAARPLDPPCCDSSSAYADPASPFLIFLNSRGSSRRSGDEIQVEEASSDSNRTYRC